MREGLVYFALHRSRIPCLVQEGRVVVTLRIFIIVRNLEDLVVRLCNRLYSRIEHEDGFTRAVTCS